jgi:hypothetical protein
MKAASIPIEVLGGRPERKVAFSFRAPSTQFMPAVTEAAVRVEASDDGSATRGTKPA